MLYIPELKRLLTIANYFGRYRLDEHIDKTICPLWLRCLIFCNPCRAFAIKAGNRAIRLREMLEALGPIFVKFGQALSTRRDLLPLDIACELAKLQDQVPPFSGATAKTIIERELGASIETIFQNFTIEPFAYASIAQVHSATLKTGEDVIIKVLRPGIETIIDQDLRVLYLLATLITKLWRDGPRLRAIEIVDEYNNTIHDELNLRIEAANASTLRRNFEKSELIYVPKVYWELISKKVLVMERIHAVQISDMATLKKQHVNLKVLAERGVEIFFTQVFRDSFFHADMHPGNIFVDIADPNNPKYCAVDFGIMGTLSKNDQRYLAENLIAFFNRDYRKVATLHVESGWVPPNTRIDQFESAIRSVCEPIFQLPLAKISFANVLIQLFHTASRFNMQVQPQLVLLQKTLINIEGLGRELYPGLDLWATAKPFLERWLKQQMGFKSFLKNVRTLAPYWLEKTPELPELMHRTLLRLSQSPTGYCAPMEKPKHHHRSKITTILLSIAALFVGSIAMNSIFVETIKNAPSSILKLSAFFTFVVIGALGATLLGRQKDK